MKSQREKIIEMCKDGEWHCGNEFRAAFIFSPHKRRIEIEGRKNQSEPITGDYFFEERRCEHGHSGVKDYLMQPTLINQPPKVDEKFKREIIQPMLFSRAQI